MAVDSAYAMERKRSHFHTLHNANDMVTNSTRNFGFFCRFIVAAISRVGGLMDSVEIGSNIYVWRVDLYWFLYDFWMNNC